MLGVFRSPPHPAEMILCSSFPNWYPRCAHLQDLLTGVLPHNVPAAAAACLVVKYVEPHIMACLQPCGATVMEFVWIPLLLLFTAVQRQ